MKESNWMRQVMLRCSALKDTVIFRINVGMAWTSAHKPIKLGNGDVLLKEARPFKTGVPKGFHDLFGVRKITITDDMIGKEIATVFTIETKTAKGRPTVEQLAFQKTIKSLGGVSVIARPGDDIEGIFSESI